MVFETILKSLSRPSSWRNTVDRLLKHSGWYQILAVYDSTYFIQVSLYESSAGKFISSELNGVRLDPEVDVRSWRECRRSRIKNLCYGFKEES